MKRIAKGTKVSYTASKSACKSKVRGCLAADQRVQLPDAAACSQGSPHSTGRSSPNFFASMLLTGQPNSFCTRPSSQYCSALPPTKNHTGGGGGAPPRAGGSTLRLTTAAIWSAVDSAVAAVLGSCDI